MKFAIFFLGVAGALFHLTLSQAEEWNTNDFNSLGYCFDSEDCTGAPFVDIKITHKGCIETPQSKSWLNESTGACVNR